MAQLDETGEGAAERPTYRRWTEESGAGHDGDGGAPSRTRRIAREFGDRLESRVNWTLEAAADRLEDTAGRLDGMGAGRDGLESAAAARAGGMAHSVAGVMESTAEFLRTNDVESLREELRRRMRERPLQTLLIGVAAGWVMGKILR
jgi:hypothetical protein